MSIVADMKAAGVCEGVARISNWVARIFAVLLFLFWGAFFVEHLVEWFLRPEEGLPPRPVWVAQVFHFVMLIGLGMIIKWDRLGSLVTIVGTVAFFSSIGYGGFPLIALLNLLPVAFLGVYWYLRSQAPTEAQ